MSVWDNFVWIAIGDIIWNMFQMVHGYFKDRMLGTNYILSPSPYEACISVSLALWDFIYSFGSGIKSINDSTETNPEIYCETQYFLMDESVSVTE